MVHVCCQISGSLYPFSLPSLWRSHYSHCGKIAAMPLSIFFLCCREKRNVKDAKWISATVCQAFAKDLWDIIPVDFAEHIGVWNCVTWVFLSISAMEIGFSALCISGQVREHRFKLKSLVNIKFSLKIDLHVMR